MLAAAAAAAAATVPSLVSRHEFYLSQRLLLWLLDCLRPEYMELVFQTRLCNAQTVPKEGAF